MNTITRDKNLNLVINQLPIIANKERVLIWEKVREVWNDRRPRAIQELRIIRNSLDRKLPTLK